MTKYKVSVGRVVGTRKTEGGYYTARLGRGGGSLTIETDKTVPEIKAAIADVFNGEIRAVGRPRKEEE